MITPQDQFLTSHGPMKEWFDLAREMETRPGVLAASPIPMQPWLDVKEGGWSAVVYTDNDPELAQSLADELANKAWDLREQFWIMDLTPPDGAIHKAVAGEGLLFPSCPSIAEFHAGELRHQIEFGGPDVSEQHR